MKKLLFLLNCILFVNSYSINYYTYNVNKPYITVGYLVGDTYATNYNGLSFNLLTNNPFEIKFDQNTLVNYSNPAYHAFRNIRIINSANNINTLSLQGIGSKKLFYTQRIDLKNSKLKPNNLELILSGDNGENYINLENSEINLALGKLLLKKFDNSHLNSIKGKSIINGWIYNSQSFININIFPKSELIFNYNNLNMESKSLINIDQGTLTLSGSSSNFSMKNKNSKINLNSGKIKILSSNIISTLQNLTSNFGQVIVDGNSTNLKLSGNTNLENTLVDLKRGEISIDNLNLNNSFIKISNGSTIKIANGSLNGNLILDNHDNGIFKATNLNLNNGIFIYNGGKYSQMNNFGRTKINNGFLKFNDNNPLSGFLTLNNGAIEFNRNTLYGGFTGGNGIVSGSLDVIGGGYFGVDLKNSKYQTVLNSKDSTKSDKITSDYFIKNLNTILVQGDSLSASDYKNKKFLIAKAPNIDGNKKIIYGKSLPVLLNLKVINDNSISEDNVTLVGELKPVSSLINYIPNNQKGAKTNIQQVIKILPSNKNQNTLSNGAKKLQAALYTLNNQQVYKNLSSLHAEPYSSHLTVGLEQNDLFLNMLVDHSMFEENKYRMDLKKTQLKNNMWLDMAYVNGDVNGENHLGDFKYSLFNFIIGKDLFKKNNLNLGIYSGYGKHSMNEHDMAIQKFKTNTYHLGSYGKYNYRNFIFSGTFGCYYGDNASKRNITIGNKSGISEDDFSSYGMYTGIKGHYPIIISEKFKLTPSLGVSYSYIYQEKIVEKGFDMANLKIQSTNADSLITSLGLNFSFNKRIKYIPTEMFLFLKYEHDWSANEDSNHNIEASFKHTPDNSVVFSGQNRGENLILCGLGTNLELTNNFLLGGGLVYSHNTNGKEIGIGLNFQYTWK